MILGIESSCDDSSFALMSDDFSLVRYAKITQENDHAKYGGVVPELAARLHTAAIPNLVSEFRNDFDKIDAIAVTNEPGLSVSLISGLSAAKALSIAINRPLIGVNHLIGHIYSLFLDREIALPLGVLLVSGGHTMVLNINERGKIEVLCSTSDDSFGESFDKVAKMLGFDYPGGALIDKLAQNGENEFEFTIPLRGEKRLEYSFSGLKNQVRTTIEKLKSSANSDVNSLSEKLVANIAASFQNTAITHILDKLKIIFDRCEFRRFGVVGGASANSLLRKKLMKLCLERDCELLCAPLEFCSDNAAMIARAGLAKLKNSRFSDIDELKINPRCSLNGAFLDL